jgi:hypothetical protein
MKNQRCWKRSFEQHEIKVLDAFLASLPQRVCEKFNQQMNAVGKVQRLGDGADVNLYSKRMFKLIQLDCEGFEGMAEEQLVATLVPLSHEKIDLQANIWFVEGRPFTIEFRGEYPINTPVEWSCELKVDFDEKKEGGA